jgi:hypothetical protein
MTVEVRSESLGYDCKSAWRDCRSLVNCLSFANQLMTRSIRPPNEARMMTKPRPEIAARCSALQQNQAILEVTSREAEITCRAPEPLGSAFRRRLVPLPAVIRGELNS